MGTATLFGAALALCVASNPASTRTPPLQPVCWPSLTPHPSRPTHATHPPPARRPDVVVACRNASDCTADVQAALDDATGRKLVFPAQDYVVTPLVLRANHTLLHFAAGARLLAKPGAFLGGADTLLTVQGALWGQSCNASCACALASNITLSGFGATFQMHRDDYTRHPCAQRLP